MPNPILRIAIPCLLALAHGCWAPNHTQPALPQSTQPLTIVGFADREIIKARHGITDPALLEQQVHDQVYRDACLRLPSFSHGVPFTLRRANPADAPLITFADPPLPSTPAPVPEKAVYHSSGTGLSIGVFTLAPATQSSAALPTYSTLAGYPASPAEALPLVTTHELAIEQCYRDAILQHLAATRQTHLLAASGRVFPTPEIRTWYLDVPAGKPAPGETTTALADRRFCRVQMKIRVHLDDTPSPAPPPTSAALHQKPSTQKPIDHAARNRPILLANPISPKSPAADPNSLTDGLLASSFDLDDPAWQATQGDLQATIDLGQPTNIRILCSRYFQRPDAAVLFPGEVQYWLSSDGKEFHKSATVPNAVSPNESDWIREYWIQLDQPISARYLRVIAKNQSKNARGWIFADEILVNPVPRATATKPIRGTWIVLDSPNATTEYWQKNVADCAALGMEYLVIHFSALNGQAFYNSKLLPHARQKCADALETVLAAADQHHMKVFVSNGFAGDGESSQGSPRIDELRRNITREIAANYAHHSSFYGWYWPDEAAINGHFSSDYIDYVNDCSALARKLTPKARILIAPFGGRRAADDQFFRVQLQKLDVDIIAYQDEVGASRAGAYDNDWFFRRLQNIHRDVPRVELWADMETFDLSTGKWTSPQFPRLQAQIENISPHVSTILIYRHISTMAASPSAADQESSDFPLLQNYRDWLKANHPSSFRP